SYILKDPITKEYKQVGSSCLEDYTGVDPAAVLFIAQMQKLINVSNELLEEYGNSGRTNAVDTTEYLADVSFITSEIGFISSTRARETGEIATFNLACALDKFLGQDKAVVD